MLHVDGSGNIWIADAYGHTVTQYTPQGQVLLSLGTFGEAGMDARHFAQPTDISTTADGKFIFPHSLTVMGNRVYVADREGARVQIFDLDGNFLKARCGGMPKKCGDSLRPRSQEQLACRKGLRLIVGFGVRSKVSLSRPLPCS